MILAVLVDARNWYDSYANRSGVTKYVSTSA